ncbi:hypothetical protein P3X46_023982 [Hevea brasiliensis]|uniref:Uncharacterized protein n=1 Tax=Hevea brasiliensis TaxID=3981 RepID=A0ABQ9LDR5_HEVBR|nr:uncharacterized protein LOC110648607 [Hevea brasiliensis]KAJ9164404.1 hypothetical protein P3X46_023982 [Hevea brasiliensis]
MNLYFASSLCFLKRSLFIKMAFGKPLSTFSISMVILVLVFTSFVHSSRTRFQGGVADDYTATAAQDLESHLVKSLGKRASTIVAEDSAREVPTGPNPLHHNNNPARTRAL